MFDPSIVIALLVTVSRASGLLLMVVAANCNGVMRPTETAIFGAALFVGSTLVKKEDR